MEPNKFYILSAQCAKFFNPMLSLDKTEKIDLLEKVNGKCGAILDGEPVVLPVPPDGPPDIPRFQLNSKDNAYRYGISLVRSDLSFHQIDEPNSQITDVSIDLLKFEKELLNIYVQEKSWKITRLALIVDYVAELEDKTSEFIMNNFLKQKDSYSSVELSLLKKGAINGHNINRWFRIKCIERVANSLHLKVDINTFAEEKLDIGVDEMIGFYNGAIEHMTQEISSTFKGLIK